MIANVVILLDILSIYLKSEVIIFFLFIVISFENACEKGTKFIQTWFQCIYFCSLFHLLRLSRSATREEVRVVCPHPRNSCCDGVLHRRIHRQRWWKKYIEIGKLIGIWKYQPMYIKIYILNHEMSMYYLKVFSVWWRGIKHFQLI